MALHHLVKHEFSIETWHHLNHFKTFLCRYLQWNFFWPSTSAWFLYLIWNMSTKSKKYRRLSKGLVVENLDASKVNDWMKFVKPNQEWDFKLGATRNWEVWMAIWLFNIPMSVEGTSGLCTKSFTNDWSRWQGKFFFR